MRRIDDRRIAENIRMKRNTSLLDKLSYVIAVALALFSGSVSMVGLMKFAPGAEIVIAIMALLFEAGKLASFSLLHKQMPVAIKAVLTVLGVVLMTLNIVGVSGFLSNSYEHEVTAAHAVTHAAEAEAAANVATLERQLKAAETAVDKARDSLGKAKGDRDQIKAVNNVIAAAVKERDALAAKLGAAQAKQAKSEGATIQSSAEFAAIAFVAAATNADQDRVAHFFILGIASLPDLLAVFLLLGAGHKPAMMPVLDAANPAQAPVEAPAPVAKPKLTARQIAAKKGWETRRRNAARKTAPKLVKS
jgi:hypothetical protein